MQPLKVTPDELIKAIRWRLGVPTDADAGRSDHILDRMFSSSDAGNQEQVRRICRFLNDALETAVRQQLGLSSTGIANVEDREFHESLWRAVQGWVRQDAPRRSPRVSRLLSEAVSGKKNAAAVASRSVPAAVPNRTASVPASPPTPSPPADMNKPTDNPRPTGPQWKYVPVPAAEPDLHPESDALEQMTPEESRLLAARVRGKKHKHEGTNCDDWYEVGMAGPWTVIAVSDGAGSKKLSRVGARVSCQEAVRALTGALADHRLTPRAADFARKDDKHATFLDPDVEFVQQRMHEAFQGAFAAVEKAWRERADEAAYAKMLTRRLVFEDLSGTLLVAAHASVRVQGRQQSLVVSCQIGDGVVAGLDPMGVVVVLGAPDSGDYSGETDFLTSRRQLEPANLQRKTFGFAGPLRALLVMSDGVADDYFPADPGVARLYADLVLNGILPPAVAVGEEALAEVSEHTAPNFDPSSLDMEAEAVTANGPQRVMLRSAATYASELGRDVCRVAGDPAFLTAGARNAPLAAASPKHSERLRLWLDAYQVRGSFDDRTLVVLHHERAV
jgi:hypothetical protein